MARVRALQTSFNAGVIDPILHGRADLAQYYRGMKEGKNVVVSPRGGVKRRPGLLSLGELPQTITRISSGITPTAPEGGTAANANDDNTATVVLSTNNISTVDPYVLIHYDLGSAKTVTYADAVGLTMTAGSSAEWAIQFSTDNVSWTTLQGNLGTIDGTAYTQRRAGPVTARYWRIAKVGGTDAGTAKAQIQDFNLWEQDGAYGNVAALDFSFNVEQTYCLVFTDQNVDVYRDGVYQVSVLSPYTSAQIAEITHTQSVDVAIIFHQDVQTQELSRVTDTDWRFSAISFTNIPTYDYGSGAEAVISSTRGWPACGTFHDGRLIMGGLKGRPTSLLASKTNDYYNLDLGTGLDDEGIFRTLDTNQLNAIRAIKSGRHLQVFTSGEEFYCPEALITPGNVGFVAPTSYGAKAAVLPVVVDGVTLFLQKTGNVLREYVYTFSEDAYVAPPTTLLASHLISDPVDMAALPGSREDDSNYVYLVNDDGTMAVFNTLRSEEVAAWTWWETSGEFKAAATVEDDLYVVVKRTINGAEAWFLELADTNTYTDCALQGTEDPETDTITGLDHLDGEECRVRGDGAVLANVTPSSGSATLEHAVSEWEIGLDWTVEIQTMPLNMDFQDGPTLTERKRLIRAVLKVYESLGIFVNGVRLPDRQFGAVLNTAPIPYTGDKEKRLLGWDREGVVTITQTDPVPLFILAILVGVEA